MKSLNFRRLSLKPFILYLLLIGFLLFSGMQCKKDATGIDALPPATQEGKETFGCLVNGEAFTPKGYIFNPDGGPTLSSYYQYLNSSTAQGFYFNLSARYKKSGPNKSVSIGADNVIIKQGQTYILKNYQNSNEIYGSYAIISNGLINEYSTINDYKGELYISKFDELNQIVSGTFWFDAVNDKGDKVEVREGRFDVHYVK
ncbi:MAG: hypothetical protein IE931_02965 [Sphingobacteriales bacterium]|nr:hypothetical protein [Sphingobacteriales bacterium]